MPSGALIESSLGVEFDSALAESIIAHCRGHLAHFRYPRPVEPIDGIPRQDNGKLYRNELRNRFRQAQTN